MKRPPEVPTMAALAQMQRARVGARVRVLSVDAVFKLRRVPEPADGVTVVACTARPGYTFVRVEGDGARRR